MLAVENFKHWTMISTYLVPIGTYTCIEIIAM